MQKIAIIDDDQDIIEATTMLLESKGYEIINASNVIDGFKLIEREKPDLIILDVMMDEPDDGFFLALKLRKNEIHTPIIMFTSVSKAMGMEFGPSDTLPVNEFLEKPIASDILLSKIDNLLKEEA